MTQYVYKLKGAPISLYMTNAIENRVWDKLKEAIVTNGINIESQHHGPNFNQPIKIEIIFYLPRKAYKSNIPALKGYVNFIEKILHDTIIPKDQYIFELDAKKKVCQNSARSGTNSKKLSDTKGSTKITITKVKM